MVRIPVSLLGAALLHACHLRLILANEMVGQLGIFSVEVVVGQVPLLRRFTILLGPSVVEFVWSVLIISILLPAIPHPMLSASC